MKKAWLITLLSGLTFIGAAIPMALRIRRFKVKLRADSAADVVFTKDV